MEYKECYMKGAQACIKIQNGLTHIEVDRGQKQQDRLAPVWLNTGNLFYTISFYMISL
jgi:hypothetical protein